MIPAKLISTVARSIDAPESDVVRLARAVGVCLALVLLAAAFKAIRP